MKNITFWKFLLNFPNELFPILFLVLSDCKSFNISLPKCRYVRQNYSAEVFSKTALPFLINLNPSDAAVQ